MLKRLGWIVSTLVVLLLAAEAVLRLLPVSTRTSMGYHVHPDVLAYPPGHVWRVSTGWDMRNSQTLRSNNMGFAAQRDFVPDPTAVALIGDSYVEASMLAETDRPAVQLEAALEPRRPVYAMGGPGSSLLDYAVRMQWAHEQLRVRDMVILMEQGDLRQALCGSGNVHSACLDPTSLQPRTERRAQGGAINRILGESALAQYLASQLKLRPSDALNGLRRLFESRLRGDAAPKGLPALSAPAIESVIRAFFERLAPMQPSIRLVVVVDGRRTTAAPTPDEAGFANERRLFIEAARGWGAHVIDAEDVYRPHLTRSRRSLVVGPYDSHLNATGVGLLMTAAAKELNRLEGRP